MLRSGVEDVRAGVSLSIHYIAEPGIKIPTVFDLKLCLPLAPVRKSSYKSQPQRITRPEEAVPHSRHGSQDTRTTKISISGYKEGTRLHKLGISVGSCHELLAIMLRSMQRDRKSVV